MLQFLKGVGATIVGLFLFCIILMIVGGAIIGVIASKEDEVEVKDNTVLHLRIDKPIVEREAEDELSPLEALPGFSGGSIGLVEVIESIKHGSGPGSQAHPQFYTSGHLQLCEPAFHQKFAPVRSPQYCGYGLHPAGK